MYKFALLITILLLLSMIQTRHALPLRNIKDSSAVFFDSNSSDNIVIIIPKPDVGTENTAKTHMKFHTVSCFQDIIEEEEEENEDDLEDDPLMLFFDEYDFTDNKEEDKDEGANSTLYGLLDFFHVVKDTIHSVWNFPWTTFTNPFIKQNEMNLKFQFHFDV